MAKDTMKLQTIALLLCLVPTMLMARTEYESQLLKNGYNTATVKNWSDSSEIRIDMPVMAYVNISGVTTMPQMKNKPTAAWLELYDGKGNYFKKRILCSGQGNTSFIFEKRNLKIDFCEDEWVGDETPDIFFGNWVKQDSYHLKAYYCDRFKGLAVVAYHLYDQVIADRGPFQGRGWARAGIEALGYDEKALCHPDGFPAAVYLNGTFFGIYSWQMKKHRRNMNLIKDVPEMIHIDGPVRNNYLFDGTIDWSYLELKNPKQLYYMDGTEYVGDNRGEIMDESSAFFNLDTDTKKVKQYKANTAKVKKYILQLSLYHKQLTDLRKAKTDSATMRKEIERRFDVVGMIDYWLFTLVTDNYDGIDANWQWVTYDGTRWFVFPYDLDCTFGLENFGNFLYPPHISSARGEISTAPYPLYWMRQYYWKEVKARYAQLRRRRIFDKENIMAMLHQWTERIGDEMYANEWKKWPNSPCIQTPVYHANWKKLDNWNNFNKTDNFDLSANYVKGDIVKWKDILWQATCSTTGVYPASQLGYNDSMERVEGWLEGRLEHTDNQMGFVMTGIAGDLNGDGALDVVDIMMIVRHILGFSENFDTGMADANHNGKVDVTDVMMWVDKLLGK